MPHSTKASGDSNSTYSFDLLGPMESNPAFHAKPGVALSSSNRNSLQSNARKRNSLPGVDAYADLIGKSEIDELMQKHLGNRTSMVASYNNSSKHRTQFYEEHFQYKDNVNGSVRERVQRESPVIAELRTNVIVSPKAIALDVTATDSCQIKDEFTLVTDMSYHLAARYTRPDSVVMVKVDHSACLALGGTFDPCYILTITTVPSHVGPTMNKRNAALIQSFMADILSVPAERGIIKFEPIAEENFAINGNTMLGEIERQEKQQANDHSSAVRRVISNAGRKSMPNFRKSASKLEGISRADSKIEESKMESVDELATQEPKSMSGAVDNKQLRRRSTPNHPSAATTGIVSPDGVFELPTSEMDKQRPSTAHSHSASTGSNGLRMNGISNAMLAANDSKPPNGRPRTFSGEAASVQEQIKYRSISAVSNAAPPPPPIRTSQPSKRDRPHSFLKTDPSKLLGKTVRPTSAHGPNSHPPVDENKPRPRDSYVDGLMGTPTAMKHFLSGDATKDKAAQEAPLEKTLSEGEQTANTAKRRSTITATPKIPSPPPVPESMETKSTRSLKIGKRKSAFLTAFRRITAAG